MRSIQKNPHQLKPVREHEQLRVSHYTESAKEWRRSRYADLLLCEVARHFHNIRILRKSHHHNSEYLLPGKKSISKLFSNWFPSHSFDCICVEIYLIIHLY